MDKLKITNNRVGTKSVQRIFGIIGDYLGLTRTKKIKVKYELVYIDDSPATVITHTIPWEYLSWYMERNDQDVMLSLQGYLTDLHNHRFILVIDYWDV